MLPPRPARAPVVALLATLLVALLPTAAAHAADGREVSGGRLDWGVKSSFRSYLTGPAAQGGWELQDGATAEGDSQFRFHSAKGTYDAGRGALEAAYQGGVRFTGHKNPDGSYALDLVFSAPSVRIADGKGTLYLDVTSKARKTNKATTTSQVPFASLDLSGVHLRDEDAVALADVPATLTAEGEKAFAGFYKAGAALDPVGLSADMLTAPGASAPPQGEFTGAAVDWGVRRTFREYVTGPASQGKWQLSDGAQDGGALFRFPQGKGTYDMEAKTLDASFAGTLRFTGKHLDLAFGGVKAAVKDGKGTLTADVAGNGRGTGKDVPLVTFDASGLAEKGGLAVVSEAPAKLTAEGAKAFGGVYQEGADMDPVSLAVPLDGKAAVPALPSSPERGKASPAPSPSASAAPAAASSSSSSSSGSSFPVLPVTVGGIAVLVLAGGAFLWVRKRRAVSAVGDSDSVSGE
ncbi:HtaA domain-containing protein [Streptomyces sp. UNOC14_S4]|uniref:HtaA domain-containing protein n=1 Tax=Streptomyces sp. UNOC14_S4 TaxID=2872340 RepID=UPI001E52053F|nr:HtaA domain-containing protein [Streptomyces sp. UNOC14_S4]MCC3767556.1 HtaA domain-containing protein [Streptomyces sp. UNOC14_S4]